MNDDREAAIAYRPADCVGPHDEFPVHGVVRRLERVHRVFGDLQFALVFKCRARLNPEGLFDEHLFAIDSLPLGADIRSLVKSGLLFTYERQRQSVDRQSARL